MKIKKQDLLTALEIVKPGLSNKDRTAQTASFAFMGNRIVTYNDEISVSHPVEGIDLNGALQADILYDLLKKIKKDEIELIVKKNEVQVKCGRLKAGFTLEQEITLPLEEIGDPGRWRILPDDFIHFMKFSLFSCSHDMTKPLLTCVHVSKDGYVESSDNWRATRCKLGGEMPFELLIPADSVAKLVEIAPTRVAQSEGWVHFKTEQDTIMSCRVLADDKFPAVESVMDVKGLTLSLPGTINDVLDRATIFAKRDSFQEEKIVIELDKNRIKITSEADEGWFEEVLNIKWEEDAVTFAITPSLLKDILKETQDCILGEKVVKFSGAGWEHITALRQVS